MLVLTRKTEEQILIGDNIKITLVRVRGNSVRIGIDAPRDVRIVRGELESLDRSSNEDSDFELSQREQVFAHPQAKLISGRVRIKENRSPKSPGEPSRSTSETTEVQPQTAKPPMIVGSVRRLGQGEKPTRAPLAGFVSAT